MHRAGRARAESPGLAGAADRPLGGVVDGSIAVVVDPVACLGARQRPERAGLTRDPLGPTGRQVARVARDTARAQLVARVEAAPHVGGVSVVGVWREAHADPPHIARLPRIGRVARQRPTVLRTPQAALVDGHVGVWVRPWQAVEAGLAIGDRHALEQ